MAVILTSCIVSLRMEDGAAKTVQDIVLPAYLDATDRDEFVQSINVVPKPGLQDIKW
jgi:hypothetical protein